MIHKFLKLSFTNSIIVFKITNGLIQGSLTYCLFLFLFFKHLYSKIHFFVLLDYFVYRGNVVAFSLFTQTHTHPNTQQYHPLPPQRPPSKGSQPRATSQGLPSQRPPSQGLPSQEPPPKGSPTKSQFSRIPLPRARRLRGPAGGWPQRPGTIHPPGKS